MSVSMRMIYIVKTISFMDTMTMMMTMSKLFVPVKYILIVV